MSTHYDIVVVGAGLLGLATARELQSRHPALRLAVVDKESEPGLHQSGHNSGVLHAGVYYKPGSLKAQLCVQGKRAMERFADEHDVAYETCGKLIVALDETELDRLADLEVRGRENGVPGLRMVGQDELREIEPHAAGIRALYSPGTGIIDFAEIVRKLSGRLAETGVDFFFGHEVLEVLNRKPLQIVRTDRGVIQTKHLISCAGLHSDRLARQAGAEPDVQIIPFRGDYYTLKPEARFLCKGLIYPVPDPALPFLGVHFTKRIDGNVWAGPNAVLATAREGYRRSQLDVRDLVETVTYPGFAKLATTWWRTGAAEVWRDAVKSAFVRDLQRYVPEVRSDQLVFGPSGVRAQAVGRDGALVDDFKLLTSETSLHVLNAPSPAATASLAIAEQLANRADEAFRLDAYAHSTVGSTSTTD